MDRDLPGRCGSCAFFLRTHVDAQGVGFGDCKLGCWPSPVRESATCGSYAQRGVSTDHLARKVKASRRGPRRSYDREPPPERPPLPKEIDLDMDQQEFRRVLTDVLREELGLSDVALGDRWQGGELVLVPGRDGTQEKRLPLDAFFKKIVMVRDKLRLLEQKVNSSALTEADKLTLQQYITGCYGSLTTFNVLFRDREDWFVGSGSKD